MAILATGLCGFIRSEGPADSAALEAMARAMGAENPGAQHHVSGCLGIYAGAGMEKAGLAAANGLVAAFAGNPRWSDGALKSLAGDKGDAAALLEGYRRHGDAILDHVRGSFSLIVAHKNSGTALLAIDRLGIEPLCWGKAPDGTLLFASKTDAIRAYPGMTATVPPQAIFNYLYYFLVPAPTTIYAEQTKLRAGECLDVRNGNTSPRLYWRMPYAAASEESAQQWSEKLHAMFETVMKRATDDLSPDTTGAFLSGGLDSSTVAGFLAKAHGGTKTFTIAFDDPRYDESSYARIAASRFGTEHHEYHVTPDDILKVMSDIARIYDEPYGNTSAIPAYYCAKLAREKGVETMMAGDGGDELFAGNERYVEMQRFESYGRIPSPLRKILLDPVLRFEIFENIPVFGKARRLMKRYYMAVPERLYSYSHFSGLTLDQVFKPDYLAHINPREPVKLATDMYERHGPAHMVQAMMGLDLQITLADNDIRKVSRMCELAGARVRYPMLDDELAEFSAGIPPDILLADGKLRYFFKQAMTGFLPDEVIAKKKHGFGLPFVVWVKTEPKLREAVLDQLSDFKRRGVCREDFIERMERSCQPGNGEGFEGGAWDIAMLEMWLKERMLTI